MAQNGAIGPLVTLLQPGDPMVQASAAGALWNLAGHFRDFVESDGQGYMCLSTSNLLAEALARTLLLVVDDAEGMACGLILPRLLQVQVEIKRL